MDKNNEAIEALKRISKHTQPYGKGVSYPYSQSATDFKTLKAALKLAEAMQWRDINTGGLKKTKASVYGDGEPRLSKHDLGWNNCIDNLTRKGYLHAPQPHVAKVKENE